MFVVVAMAVGDHGSVLLTDGDIEVVEICRGNIFRNNMSATCSADVLRWNDCDKITRLMSGKTEEDPENLGACSGDQSFDIIIASDCLYRNGSNTKSLFDLASRMLRKQPSCVPLTDIISCAPPTVGLSNYEESGILNPSGNGGGWYYPSCHDHSVETNDMYTTLNSDRQPVFILAYTRRMDGGEASMAVIMQAARDAGFQYEVAYDSVVDMFGNVTSERTLMWEHCIFIFTWIS
jgi:hypothetical protein